LIFRGGRNRADADGIWPWTITSDQGSNGAGPWLRLFTGGRSAAALNGSTKANGTTKSRGTESAAAKRIPLKDDPSAPTVGAGERLGRDAGQTQRLRRGERDFLVDLAMLSLAMLSAIATAALDNIPAEGMPWLLTFPALTLALLAGRGIYRPRSGSQILDDARSVVAATAVAAMSVAFMRVLLGFDPHATSQAVREWLFAALYLIVGRATVNLCDARSRSRTDAGRRTLIVGAGRVGHLLAKRVLERPHIGLRPIGFIDDEPMETLHTEGCPVLGPVWQLERLVQAHRIEHAILSFSRATHDEELAVSRQLQHLGVSVSVIPRLYEDIPDRISVERIAGLPLLSIYPSKPRGWQFKVKYALDRVLAAAALVVAAPIMLPAALGVLITMGRPILFRQRRVGLDGQEFDMLKFRTMHPPTAGGKPSMAEIEEALQNGLGPGGVEGEDRRSPFGSFLRRTSIDELPQFLNVLRGEMSIVGPRPERDYIAATLRETVYRYDARDRVKSGITGWAQVHGLRGRTSLTDRVEWDNYYIDNWSLWLDFKIALMTAVAVIRDRLE
jgi:exopolysaccharide biosynthesis polyprenyl glycosylphosphotransferase